MNVSNEHRIECISNAGNRTRNHMGKGAKTYFDDGSFGHDTQIGVQRRRRIFLDTQDVQAKRCLEFWMCHMSLFHPKTGGANEPFIFWGLASVGVPNKCDLGNHPLPVLLFSLACLDLTEHFVVRHRFDFGNWNTPFPGLFLSLLLDRIREHLGPCNVLTIQQVCRNST